VGGEGQERKTVENGIPNWKGVNRPNKPGRENKKPREGDYTMEERGTVLNFAREKTENYRTDDQVRGEKKEKEEFTQSRFSGPVEIWGGEDLEEQRGCSYNY